ncbi:ribonuclease HII [bacterium]|nr:ribonuclease HII [bacterium]
MTEAGIDEAGRGALAGPVVAACYHGPTVAGVADSKVLGRRRRERLAAELARAAERWGLGVVGPLEIDRVGVLEATMRAMALAYAAAALPANTKVAVDGNRLPPLPCPARAVVRGDALLPAVSAASIIAKVARDRMMEGLGRRWPGYGHERHRGYGTAAHLEALARLGPTPAHRRSFRPVALATMLSR